MFDHVDTTPIGQGNEICLSIIIEIGDVLDRPVFCGFDLDSSVQYTAGKTLVVEVLGEFVGIFLVTDLEAYECIGVLEGCYVGGILLVFPRAFSFGNYFHFGGAGFLDFDHRVRLAVYLVFGYYGNAFVGRLTFLDLILEAPVKIQVVVRFVIRKV